MSAPEVVQVNLVCVGGSAHRQDFSQPWDGSRGKDLREYGFQQGKVYIGERKAGSKLIVFNNDSGYARTVTIDALSYPCGEHGYVNFRIPAPEEGPMPECGCSPCRQNWIETGESECVAQADAKPEPEDESGRVCDLVVKLYEEDFKVDGRYWFCDGLEVSGVEVIRDEGEPPTLHIDTADDMVVICAPKSIQLLSTGVLLLTREPFADRVTIARCDRVPFTQDNIEA